MRTTIPLGDADVLVLDHRAEISDLAREHLEAVGRELKSTCVDLGLGARLAQIGPIENVVGRERLRGERETGSGSMDLAHARRAIEAGDWFDASEVAPLVDRIEALAANAVQLNEESRRWRKRALAAEAALTIPPSDGHDEGRAVEQSGSSPGS